MFSFEELSAEFATRFKNRHFPTEPASLYDPAVYFLGLGGKRIRPILCLMGNELFSPIEADAWELATAIELFHNFTLIHDDIMDRAPLRRGMQTVHEKYGTSTAILSGDVMMVVGYEYISRIQSPSIRKILQIYNDTAIKVCEGQQLDMDFEARERVTMDEYLEMIELKTSVLLAASLQIGSILGGAGLGNQQHISKFGKQVGGDIVAGKKTFLLIKTLEVANEAQRREIKELEKAAPEEKVAG